MTVFEEFKRKRKMLLKTEVDGEGNKTSWYVDKEWKVWCVWNEDEVDPELVS